MVGASPLRRAAMGYLRCLSRPPHLLAHNRHLPLPPCFTPPLSEGATPTFVRWLAGRRPEALPYARMLGGVAVGRVGMHAGEGNGSAVRWGVGEEEEEEVEQKSEAHIDTELSILFFIGEECDKNFCNDWNGSNTFISNLESMAQTVPVLAQRMAGHPLVTDTYASMTPRERREVLEGVVRCVLHHHGGLEELLDHRDAVRDCGDGGAPTEGGLLLHPHPAIRFASRGALRLDWREEGRGIEWKEGERQRMGAEEERDKRKEEESEKESDEESESESQLFTRLLRHRLQVDSLWGGGKATKERKQERAEEPRGQEEVQGEGGREEGEEGEGEGEVESERGRGLGLRPLTDEFHSPSREGGPVSTTRSLGYSMGDGYVLDYPLSLCWFLTTNQKECLVKEEVFTIRHLLSHFPRAYLDFSCGAVALEDGQQVAMVGRVEEVRGSTPGRNFCLLEMGVGVEGVDREGNPCRYTIKHQYWMKSKWPYSLVARLQKEFCVGTDVAMNGKIGGVGGNTFKLAGEVTTVEKMREGEEGGGTKVEEGGELISCVYPAKGAITPTMFKSTLARTCAALPMDMDPLAEIMEPTALSLRDAYLGIHGRGDKEAARDRLIFDEFFYHQTGLLMERQEAGREGGVAEEREGGVVPREQWAPLPFTLLSLLPYHLTAGQEKAVGEIVYDLRRPLPMNRLLQGDVGCGKTIVALMGLLEMVSRGFQAALMAPTEFLACQHYARFCHLLDQVAEADRPKLALLTGSTKKAKGVRDAIGSGEVRLVVGTQALISQGTCFHRLGMVVVDEQHRFGVNQRSRLVEKGGGGEDGTLFSPHLLAMSATPIPRTLALALYGDMRISKIADMPPGRTPVVTTVVTDRREAYRLVQEEVGSGGRAFVVFPRIEEKDKGEEEGGEGARLRSAVEEFGRIERGDDTEEVALLRGLPCGLVHGQMGTEDKAEAMRKFKEGETSVLFCTTVIEVGIDIPEATLMVVEAAERYGLAALHQLRGRVGRGARASRCLLLPSSPSSCAKLQVLADSQDGFLLAEEDLVRRGAGDLLGKKQSGHLPNFTLVNYQTDGPVLLKARKMAEDVVERYPGLEGLPRVRDELSVRFSITSQGM